MSITWTALYNNTILAEGLATREDARDVAVDHAIANDEDLLSYELVESIAIDATFVEFAATQGVETLVGNYGSFGELNDVTIWTRQRGGKYELRDNAEARYLHLLFTNA